MPHVVFSFSYRRAAVFGHIIQLLCPLFCCGDSVGSAGSGVSQGSANASSVLARVPLDHGPCLSQPHFPVSSKVGIKVLSHSVCEDDMRKCVWNRTTPLPRGRRSCPSIESLKEGPEHSPEWASCFLRVSCLPRKYILSLQQWRPAAVLRARGWGAGLLTSGVRSKAEFSSWLIRNAAHIFTSIHSVCLSDSFSCFYTQ